MKSLPPASLLAPLSRFLAVQMGLHFPEKRWSDLARGLEEAAAEFGFADAESCGRWLLSAPLDRRQIEILAGCLTVGETYFFRDPKNFEELQRQILPALIRARRGSGSQRLRLWSAGCCTGEEPYSMAMVLRQLLPDLRDWQVTLLATDINPRFLEKAAAGIYGAWSFRGTPEDIKQRFFQPTADGCWQISPEIREMVRFDYLNLAEDTYPSLLNHTQAMDVIFCRNVLMYFSPESAARVIENFHRALADGGHLLLGPGELPLENRSPSAVPPPALPRKSRPPAVEPAAKKLTATPPSPAAEAQSYANQGKLAEALLACERAIAADHLCAAHHQLRAMILQEQGATEQATAALKHALYLDPRCVLAHFTLGNLARARGAEAETHKHFTNALQILRTLPAAQRLAEADGITAGRLIAILTLTMHPPQRS